MASTLIKHSVSLYNSSMDKKKKDIESRDNSFISLSLYCYCNCAVQPLSVAVSPQ